MIVYARAVPFSNKEMDFIHAIFFALADKSLK